MVLTPGLLHIPTPTLWTGLELFPLESVRLKNLQLKPNTLGITFPNFVDEKELRDPTRADRILYRNHGNDGAEGVGSKQPSRRRGLRTCAGETFLGAPIDERDGEQVWASDHKGVMIKLVLST